MRQSLSTIHTAAGFTIARHIGNRLIVSRIDGREVTKDEATEQAAFYWRVVGVRGNDPLPEGPTK